ncbi:hypothetical protein ACIRBX_03580 [Kitasatospora sp. NPDC096147]|uniref:hypothetical protein n=1 Tax=Kitasatospora sp. NPDC096147 TaxID=3364093 RepID=UPI00381117A6
MSLTDLTFDEWRAFDLPTALRTAREAAALTNGHLVSVETVEHLGRPFHRALIERAGQGFALVPGGPVTLGLDLGGWQPAPGQEEDYRRSADQGFGRADDLRGHLAQALSPYRTTTVPTLLVAVRDEEYREQPEDAVTALTTRGLRLPTPDEWEHACGAGARTLFRWGDTCPLDRIPYHSPDGPQHAPNAFGLRIAHDTYTTELVADPTAVYGGDGGESACGGYGTLLGWLPLATSHHNPDYAAWLHDPDGDAVLDDTTIRPVLEL